MSATEGVGWGVAFPDVDELLSDTAAARERLDTDRITALWNAALELTSDIAEVTWIVVHATAAGWTPERLAETGHARWVAATNADVPGRGLVVGITSWGPAFDAAVAEDDARALAEVEHLGYGLLAPPTEDTASLSRIAEAAGFGDARNPEWVGFLVDERRAEAPGWEPAQ